MDNAGARDEQLNTETKEVAISVSVAAYVHYINPI